MCSPTFPLSAAVLDSGFGFFHRPALNRLTFGLAKGSQSLLQPIEQHTAPCAQRPNEL